MRAPIAFVLATVMTFVLIPVFPAMAFYGTFIVVFATAALAWFLRTRSSTADMADAENENVDAPATRHHDQEVTER